MGARARRAVGSVVLLAVGLLGGGAALGLGPGALLSPAGAATCASSGGVSVVVDYRELGGGTVTACAPDGGGKSAAAIFDSVGVSLTYATRQPGFVCRVNGVPASDPCVNASPSNAYWGLWWADGSQASWTYSSSGVGSLTVPAGGSVGWSWQQDRAAGAAVPPGVAPPVTASATPSPSPSPTSSPTSSPTASPSPSSSTPSPSGTTSSSPEGGGSPSSAPSSSGSPSAPGGTDGSPATSPSAQAAPSGSPLARSAGTRREAKKGDGAVGNESPSDSPSRKDDEAGALGVESPSDSTPSAASESVAANPDEPARVPAVVTWTVVALLATTIAVSGLVARRRRGSGAP